MGKKGKFFIVFPAIMVIAFIAYLCLDSYKTERIQKFEGPILDMEAHKSRQKPLYLGFIPEGNAVFMVRKWQPLADYLAKEVDMPVEMVFRSSYGEITTALANNEIDICLTGAFLYVLTRETVDIQSLVRRIKFGSSLYQSFVVVKKNRGIKTIHDLKGKVFAFTDKKSTTGFFLPMIMMRQYGVLDPESYFSEVIYTESHESVLLAVLTDNADAAAISSVRLYPQDPRVNDLEIIWKSEPVYLGPFSVRGELDQDLVEKLKHAFLKIGRTPETQALSAHIGIEGFEEAYDSDYDNIREAKRKWGF